MIRICKKCNKQKDEIEMVKNGFDINGNQKYLNKCKTCLNLENKEKSGNRQRIVLEIIEICGVIYRKCTQCDNFKNNETEFRKKSTKCKKCCKKNYRGEHPLDIEFEFFEKDGLKYKKCTQCGKIKLTDEFFIYKRSEKLHGECIECTRKIGNEHHKTLTGRVIVKNYQQSFKGKLADKKAHLKRFYNITLEQLNQMLKNQNDRCDICGININNSSAHVDHNHSTKRIRRLLCAKCNLGLGKFDDIILMLRAIKYLNGNNFEHLNIQFKNRQVKSIERQTLLKLQGSKCLICEKDITNKSQADHNHQTSIVRGLLCGNCNRAIGKFHDNPSLIQSAISYLKKFENWDYQI